jgi:RNA polymerase sigma factor (sigma-70 family)
MPWTGNGPMDDFGQAYDNYVWDVYAFFAYRTGRRADAEDLTQLTFERALRAWDRFDERKGSMRTWLMAIGRNALVDHYRRDRSADLEPLDGAGEERLAVEDPGIGVDPELEAALEQLGQREREVIALRYGADLDGVEIASMLDLSLANVHQILSRSLRRLRADLGGEGAGAEHARRR